MTLRLEFEQIGKKLHKLTIYHNEILIGEYERSQEAEFSRKEKEIRCAIKDLLDIYNRYGEFVVRWDGTNKKKSIRANGVEVGTIPKSCWGKPSLGA